MADNNEAPDDVVGGEAAPETSHVEQLAAVGVDVTSAEVQEAIMGDSSIEEIIAKFGDPDKAETAKPDDATSAADGEASEEDEAPDDDDKSEAESTPEPSAKDDGPPKRFRFADEEDRQHVAAAKELGITLSEYFTLQREKSRTPESQSTPKSEAEPKAKSKQPEAQPDVADKISQDIEQLESEIEQMEQESDKLADEMEFSEARKIDRKIERARDKRRDLLTEKSRIEMESGLKEQEYARQYEAVKAQSEAAAIEKYPQLGKPDSMESMAFTSFYHNYAKQDPTAFDDPNWVMTLADKFAEKTGLKSSGGKTDRPPQSPKPTKPTGKAAKQVSRSTVLTSGEGASSPEEVTVDDAEKILRDIQKLPPNQREKYERMIFSTT